MITTDELTWTDAFLVGYAPMDETHREFVDIVGAMLHASDEALLGHLKALIVHSEHHFSQEESYMQQTSFPATECHTNEHNAVLTSMRDVAQYLETGGSPDEARRLATELARWFPGHTDYLDASLAQWVAKKQLGAVPIVVRRGVANHDDT
ncbi:MAG TPA: hemerythrin domain-containing protein [Pusillimonas sp.]|uniref:hemerythrin domain-containing protein n=1 Tax=Pusillimonas sp. TaxID=3040095 RepID=UPI002CAA933D|nr:hemerythrin domain-containing protein [Pusillimonas sp.]HUH87360.1 hemerythrin domain-containing protein [Pusillimonas sp.]